MARTNNLRAYQANLVAFLSYLDGCRHPQDATFTPERLRQITPKDVERFLNFKAYGVEVPTQDDHPTSSRSTTLQFAKKAISFFMPDKIHPWDHVNRFGNPTRSPIIGQVIKKVRKAEVRGLGADRRDCRDFTPGEMTFIQTNFRENPTNGNVTKYGVPAFVNFEIHLLTRTDCSSQLQTSKLTTHREYPELALMTKLSWSKNVANENEAPWQIILGQMDPLYCVFVGLAIWFEFYFSTVDGGSPYVFDFSGDFDIPQGGDKSNEFVQKQIKKVIKADTFVEEENRLKVGCYGIRKYASTRVRRCGASRDDKDYRGRWKSKARVSDRYDGGIPFVDAKVAGMLCHGGPCSYQIREGSSVTEDWILEHVVPNLRAKSTYDTRMVKLLGKALLWVSLSGRKEWVPGNIQAKIEREYSQLVGENPPDDNPIEKRPLSITGSDANLVITEIQLQQVPPAQVQAQGQGLQGQGVQNPIFGAAVNPHAMDTLLAQQNMLMGMLNAQSQRIDANHAAVVGMLQTSSRNIRRYFSAPAVREVQRNWARGNAVVGHANFPRNEALPNNENSRPAQLSPSPVDLFVLWDEYMVGLGGRKAARLFTARERGREKNKYHRRKVIWTMVQKLIDSGLTREEAIHTIYNVYGPGETVTSIINRLKKDKKDGTLDQRLRV